MSSIEAIRAALPEVAKDMRLNLPKVLNEGALSEAQRWGVALASAYASRNPSLIDAIKNDGAAHLSPEHLGDAQAANSLMGMNNIYYRFRHMISKPEYGSMPAGLRMNHIAKPMSDKATFELMSIAVSAINGCEMCIRAHEDELVKHGVTAQQIHDAVRIAAVIHATAVSL